MNLPNDPIMLLSYLNTQLRDNYGSFDELVASLGVNKKEIEDKLEALGYLYNEEFNRFC